nr:MAG TPA: YopX protein [Caudoviricetes sp.]
MNDRYLFKAKRADNGEWVQGNLIWSNDCEDDYRAIIIPTNNSNMFTKGGAKGDLGFENWYRVNENTICQCTGLKDKNGKLIWESDIVKDLFSDACAQIKYGSYQSCFDSTKTEHVGFYVDWSGKYTKRYRKDLGYWINMVNAEVIGNIFDTQDLLGEDDE